MLEMEEEISLSKDNYLTESDIDEAEATACTSLKQELEEYLGNRSLSLNYGNDCNAPLQWWQKNQEQYKQIAAIPKQHQA
jgi:hypothetical protein